MSIHSHINQFEQFVIRNKIIVTILTATALVVSTPLYLYTVHTSRMDFCIRSTDENLRHMINEGDTADYLYSLRRSYYRCIAEQGIDVQSVPSFDEVYNAGPTEFEYAPFEFDSNSFFDDEDASYGDEPIKE